MEPTVGFLFLVGLALLVHFGRFSLKRPRRRSKRTVKRRVPTGTVVPFNSKSATPPAQRQVICGTARIIDGDSIVINSLQIRLFGIDAPEINHPYGQMAKWALVSLCKGNTVKAEIVEMDDHGRTVARCTLPDGRDLSAEMVKLGLAIDWPKFSGGVYSSLEVAGVRKKLWLADARQKGRMHVWQKFENYQKSRRPKE